MFHGIGFAYTTQDRSFFKNRRAEIMTVIVRISTTTAANKTRTDLQKENKRQESINEANALFDSAAPSTLLAMRELARTGKRRDQDEGSFMSFICKQQPELIDKFVQHRDEQRKPKLRGRSPGSKRYPKTPAASSSRRSKSKPNSQTRNSSKGSRSSLQSVRISSSGGSRNASRKSSRGGKSST